MNSVTTRLFSFVAMCLLFGTPTVVTAAGTVILIDGQNNHDWKSTTPILVQALTRDGRFDVAVATSPPRGGDMNTFRPKFSEYDAVLSNYNGDLWSEETCRALENFVSMGGALVVVHAANNSFPEWKEWNTLIGQREKWAACALERWKDGPRQFSWGWRPSWQHASLCRRGPRSNPSDCRRSSHYVDARQR